MQRTRRRWCATTNVCNQPARSPRAATMLTDLELCTSVTLTTSRLLPNSTCPDHFQKLEVCSRYRRRNCIRQTSRAIGQLCPLVPCNAAVFYLDADFLLQSFESKTPPNCFPHHQHRYGYLVQFKWQAALHTDASSDL